MTEPEAAAATTPEAGAGAAQALVLRLEGFEGPLDLLLELARGQKGVLGARMTGGGFGGCTVNLVRDEDAAEFRVRIAGEYEKATGLVPDVYVCKASEGAEEVG